MIASPVAGALSFATAANGSSAPSLDGAAARRGRYFGAAVRIDQIRADRAIETALLKDCGSVTPEIHLKWDALQPAADRWSTGPADDLIAFAGRHDLKVRGHTLLWDQSTPAWARAALERDRDWGLVEGYITAVVSRYRDGVAEWDVVNEPIDVGEARDGLRRNLFFKAFGEGYVRDALIAARAAAPRARLMINDYSFDYDNPVEHERRKAFLRLLERLRSQGAPLDGVGIQAHLDLSKGALKPQVLRPFLAEIADMGLTIAITELDVKESDLSGTLRERDQRVADEARRYLEIVLEEPAVQGVTTWGLTDRDSWLQTPEARGARLNRGLPYDAEMTPKLMHSALHSALAA